MACAIIHYEPSFSRMDVGFFIKRTLKNVKKVIQDDECYYLLYLLPICENYFSKKGFDEFVSYLKKENINKIILTKQALKCEKTEKLLNCFNTYDGLSLINAEIYEIIKKCALKKHLQLSKSSLVLYTNQPEKAKSVILKLYHFVKDIVIQTKEEEKFIDLSFYFLENYGIDVLINGKIPKEAVSVIIDGRFENGNYDFSFSDSRVLFCGKKIHRELNEILEMNQFTMEYIIENRQKNLENQQIHQFLKENDLKIVKIEKND